MEVGAGVISFNPEHKFAVPPYHRSTDKVALVGMAATSRHLTPFDDPEWEIWALNESYHSKNADKDKLPYMRRWTRWFQMHPKWDYLRPHNFNDPEHPQWLHNVNGRRRTDFPIYMLEYDPDIPGSVRYPIEEVLAPYGVRARYFTNSFGQMIALAIHLGFRRIGAYGFEMSSDTEYSHQKPNAEFWLGVALGRGIAVDLPEGCALLGEKVPLYGYEKVPGITAMHLEIYSDAMKKKASELQAELNKCLGDKERLMQQAAATKGQSKPKMEALSREMAKTFEKEINTRIKLQSALGEIRAYEVVKRDLQGLPEPGEVPLVLPKQKIQIVAVDNATN